MVALSLARARMRSSMGVTVQRRNTRTSRVCPMRWARSCGGGGGGREAGGRQSNGVHVYGLPVFPYHFIYSTKASSVFLPPILLADLRLRVRRGVPVRVENEHRVRGLQVDAQPTRPRGQDEHKVG